MFPYAAVRNVETNEVVGELDKDVALDTLLADTGLEVVYGNNNTATIRPIHRSLSASEETREPGKHLPAMSQVLMAQNQTSAKLSQANSRSEINSKEDDVVAPLEEIIVIGSHIRGVADGPSPVLIFDQAAIKLTGAATLEGLFSKIPQNFSGGANSGNNLNIFDAGRDSMTLGRGTTINLRGLGSGTTLTLVNGRRVSNSDTGAYFDASLIPLTAVERIEVLTDGASAIYGSDAVAGVVNIILRTDFDGVELTGRYAGTSESGYTDQRLSGTAGTSWSSGNALVSYELFSNDNLEAIERKFSMNAPALPYDLLPATDRQSVFTTIRQELTASMSLSVEGFYADRSTDVFGSALSSGVLSTRLSEVSNEQYGGNLGVSMSIGNAWEARLNLGVSETSIDSIGTTTAAGATTITAPGNKSDMWYVEGILDGPIFSVPAGAVRGAFGVSSRSQEFEAKNGPPGAQTTSFAGERDISSAFGEVNIPLMGAANKIAAVERLELSASVRFDDYSDFGSTVNPKYGVLWEIAPGLVFRGTQGTSFRAPLFSDLSNANSIAVMANLPDPASPSGRSLTIVAFGGNPNLGPEEASTRTVGLEWEPESVEGLRMVLNFYDIKYDNRIDLATNNVPGIFNNVDVLAPVLTVGPTQSQIDAMVNIGGNGFNIFRVGPFAVPAGVDSGDTEVIADLRLKNISVTEQNGLDFDLSYEWGSGQAEFSAGIAGNKIFESSRQVTVTSPSIDVAGTVYNPTDLTLRGRAGWQRGNWTSAVFVNYDDAYVDNTTSVPVMIDEWTTVDFTIGFAADIQSSFFSNIAITVSAQNLFDKAPPLVANIRGTGFDPTNANPLGRLLAIDVSGRW